MDPAEIKTLIENGLQGSDVQVFSEDNTHYAALVISADFEGLRSIARHQMIYRSLGALMGILFYLGSQIIFALGQLLGMNIPLVALTPTLIILLCAMVLIHRMQW